MMLNEQGRFNRAPDQGPGCPLHTIAECDLQFYPGREPGIQKPERAV